MHVCLASMANESAIKHVLSVLRVPGKRTRNHKAISSNIADRVSHDCIYEEDTIQSHTGSGQRRPQSLLGGSDAAIAVAPSLRSFSHGTSSGPSFINAIKVDPFRHDALRQTTVEVAIATEASKILGAVDKIEVMATTYFNTIYQRLSIVSKRRFYERLPHVFARPDADFIVLCLCIRLVLEGPSQEGQSMQSSLYVTIKSNISLLESTNYLSLTFVQCRLLVAFYEMGHGISPAASISIGACARTARALGLNKRNFERIVEDEASRIQAEEEKRVWWAVVNLDR
jgi:Fungal specific transcription factor domain